MNNTSIVPTMAVNQIQIARNARETAGSATDSRCCITRQLSNFCRLMQRHTFKDHMALTLQEVSDIFSDFLQGQVGTIKSILVYDEYTQHDQYARQFDELEQSARKIAAILEDDAVREKLAGLFDPSYTKYFDSCPITMAHFEGISSSLDTTIERINSLLTEMDTNHTDHMDKVRTAAKKNLSVNPQESKRLMEIYFKTYPGSTKLADLPSALPSSETVISNAPSMPQRSDVSDIKRDDPDQDHLSTPLLRPTSSSNKKKDPVHTLPPFVDNSFLNRGSDPKDSSDYRRLADNNDLDTGQKQSRSKKLGPKTKKTSAPPLSIELFRWS